MSNKNQIEQNVPRKLDDKQFRRMLTKIQFFYRSGTLDVIAMEMINKSFP